ncbi:MAG: hypothetical protein QOJ00_756 [Actinomycetota bacterium]
MIVVSLIVIVGGVNALGAAPGGPTLSSYATNAEGLAAYQTLLNDTGHRTSQLRTPLDKQRQPPAATLVAIGQSFSRREGGALRQFLMSGGVAIVGNPEAEDALSAVGLHALHWRGDGATAVSPAPGASLGDVRAVRGAGLGEWRGSAPALLQRGTHVAAVSIPVGAGRLVALADPSPLTNQWLGVADNAAFAVAIAGEGRPVVFAEYGHGFGVRNGLSAIPSRWKAALWFGGVAAVVAALSSAKRFGPPDEETDAPTPPRVLYVESLASTLARTRDYDAAVAPLKRRASALIAKRTGVHNLDDRDEQARAARIVGLSDVDAAALTTPVASDADVLALGRVVAKLEES